MPKPLQESDLIFSSTASDLKNALGELKRSNLSITNRLRSIKQDAEFVLSVSKEYGLPLIANERCGSWYIPPDRKAGSAYFKSTDGHNGQWALSLRRLNLHLIEIAGRHGGCIIVDSTRRGKSMPDALSKTIPIWVAVVNCLLFPAAVDSHTLHTPSDIVSHSEHSQIEAVIPAFVESLRGLDIDVEQLRATLSKPMRPVWVTPGLCPNDSLARCCPIVLVTASNRDSEATHSITGYVQGAADDSESWACGLSPQTFWANTGLLMTTPESELPAVIDTLLVENKKTTSMRLPTLIKPTQCIWIANNAAAGNPCDGFDVAICCSATPSIALAESLKTGYVHLACSTGKKGSRELRAELPKLLVLKTLLSPSCRVLVTCETGKDLAIGVILAILCSFYDGDGMLSLSLRPDAESVNKTLIKHRLSWIMVSVSDAAPSRATLQSVNAYLMG